MVEKPFGTDLASARELNRELLKLVDEHQIYRIDHYLGKETVQNILVLRFANGMFEPMWNRNHIDHVQITVAETVGVGHRGKFYDADRRAARHGAEPSVSAAVADRDGAADPLRRRFGARGKERGAVRDPGPREAEALRNFVRGQYRGGRIGDTRDRRLPRRSKTSQPDSTTETYVGAEADHRQLALGRRAVLPAHRQGARRKRTEIAIKFKQAPFAMFRDTPVDRLAQNYLVIGVQPNEGIALQFNTKMPGPSILIDGVEMKFRYKDYFKAEPSTGYETLIYDCMIGDNILFQRADSVEAGWKAVQPFLDAWKKAGAEGLQIYKAGSEGPEEANELLRRDGRSWRKFG